MQLTIKEKEIMKILKTKTSADINTFLLVYRDKKYAKLCLRRFINMFKILNHTHCGRFKIDQDKLNKLLDPELVKPFEKNSTLNIDKTISKATFSLKEDCERIEAYNQAIMKRPTCSLIDLIRDKQEQITCIQMELYRRQRGSDTL